MLPHIHFINLKLIGMYCVVTKHRQKLKSRIVDSSKTVRRLERQESVCGKENIPIIKAKAKYEMQFYHHKENSNQIKPDRLRIEKNYLFKHFEVILNNIKFIIR